jgi:dihydroxyacetone kinase-like protein
VTRLLDGIAATADAVRNSAPLLNELDANAGDGDLGVTMVTAATTVLDLIPGLAGAAPADVFKTCGTAIARAAPSTSGTLVATALLRAGRVVAEDEVATGSTVAKLLSAALTGIQERGKAEVGAKTMLDALAPAADAAASTAAAGSGVDAALSAAADAAEVGARATAGMTARHGRAGWLADRAAGHEDGGARLVAIILAAASASAAQTAPAGSA